MLTFAKPFRRVYSRTRRNLRCFPMCSASGHVVHSFCGQPVTLIFSTEMLSLLSGCSVSVTAEFVPLGEPASLVENRIPGEIVDDCVVFNRECAPYAYDWISSKHKATMYHVFRVQVTLPTGQTLFSVDSLPFIVSPYLADLDDQAKQSPLRIVMSVIRTRIPKKFSDADWGPIVNAVAEDTPSPISGIWSQRDADESANAPPVDANLVNRLVVIEKLHTILLDLFDFILVSFQSWGNEAAVNADIDAFLVAKYEVSLTQLARKLAERGCFDPRLDKDDFKDAYEDVARSAIIGARDALGQEAISSVLSQFTQRLHGVFIVPKSFLEFIAAVHAAMGWESRVRHICDDDEHAKFLIALNIVSPTEARLAFGNCHPLSPSSWLSLVPAHAMRIGAFQLGMCSGRGDHVIFVWPLTWGLCMVICYSPSQRTISVLSISADGRLDLRMQYQEYRSGGWFVVGDFRKVLERETE